MKYFHADVFSSKVLSGNGVSVVFLDEDFESKILLQIAQELKQFETVFVLPTNNDSFPIRIFTVQEEIPFAGHPVLGTVAVIHNLFFKKIKEKEISITFNQTQKKLTLKSSIKDNFYSVEMNQGKADFIYTLKDSEIDELLTFTKLKKTDIDFSLPVEVVSTGLPYLLIPLKTKIENAVITETGFESFLEKRNAKFSYFFQTDTLECRSWDNTGTFEDVATGSAAGPLFSYLEKNKKSKTDELKTLLQGRFCGRPSKIEGLVNQNGEVVIYGDVSLLIEGEIKSARA